MTADDARLACGKFGCITGKGEKHGHNVKVFGSIIITDSYYPWFVTTCEMPLLFRLKYIDSFYSIPEGKRMLKLPVKFKKFVTLGNENKGGMVDVFDDNVD
jgi:hypothetical protein